MIVRRLPPSRSISTIADRSMMLSTSLSGLTCPDASVNTIDFPSGENATFELSGHTVSCAPLAHGLLRRFSPEPSGRIVYTAQGPLLVGQRVNASSDASGAQSGWSST